jgi:hypothetical protein
LLLGRRERERESKSERGEGSQRCGFLKGKGERGKSREKGK